MILVAEDDERIAALLMQGLHEAGYRCERVSDGHQAIDRILGHAWRVVILDLMLPGCSGLDVLAAIRKGGCDVPVLVLSARNSVDQRAEGLNTGADDYLPKPFSFIELIARIRALERRSRTFQPEILSAGKIELDAVQRQVYVRGQPVLLTEQEYRLLEHFMRHPLRVYSREQLAQLVWGYNQDIDENAVEAAISRLRRKLGERAKNSCIETLRGAGYRFNPGTS